MKHLRRLIRGCGTLPHCGAHPGTPFLILFVVMGAIAGAKGDFFGAAIGAAVMLALFGSVYLCGAYGRAEDEERYAAAAGHDAD